jgi:tRNA(fMet)-specific endonuclease VapC
MDTDHTSYILRGEPSIIENVQQYDAAITIITVRELFDGWVSRANAPKQADRLAARLRDRLVEIYAKLAARVGYFKTVEILDFIPDAASCLKQPALFGVVSL